MLKMDGKMQKLIILGKEYFFNCKAMYIHCNKSYKTEVSK